MIDFVLLVWGIDEFRNFVDASRPRVLPASQLVSVSESRSQKIPHLCIPASIRVLSTKSTISQKLKIRFRALRIFWGDIFLAKWLNISKTNYEKNCENLLIKRNMATPEWEGGGGEGEGSHVL